ncbi:MAG: hypothetical protein LAT81_14290, partial [Oceanicaulis sp.]|nr:hypothetical protein [Oceanicaulis sp.]
WNPYHIKENHYVPCYGVFFKCPNIKGATAILIVYVDDIMCLSDNPRTHLDEIAKRIDCSEITDVDITPQKHIGVEIYVEGDTFYTSIEGYTKQIDDKEIQEEIERVTKQKIERYNKPYILPITVETDKEYKPADINLFQQYTGMLCWLATCHPALCSRHGEISKHTHYPSPTAWQTLVGTLKEIMKDGVPPMAIKRVEKPEIRIYTDSSWQYRTARHGTILQIADENWGLENTSNIVFWKSSSDGRKHNSSTDAEVMAIKDGLVHTSDVLEVMKDIFGRIPTKLYVDSKPAISRIEYGSKSMTEQGIIEHITDMIENAATGKIELRHVPTDLQMADALTKIKRLNSY